MGEYAIRKSDGERIKIGTCEMMYYLRFEDRDKVQALAGNVDPMAEGGLFYRLPFEDEDEVLPGQYKNPDRGERIWKSIGQKETEEFRDQTIINDVGILQLHHESGLLINVPCYHGLKLPEPGPSMQTLWNGKSWFLELRALKSIKQSDGSMGTRPTVHCRHCRQMWSYDWKDVWDYIPEPMRSRLWPYAADVMAA